MWLVEKESHDYGIDLRVEIVVSFNREQKEDRKRGGLVTGAIFSVQLKGTDNIKISKDKQHILHSCKVSAINYYLQRPEPVVYLVYDTINRIGYWLFIQNYIRNEHGGEWKTKKSLTIKIPVANIFDAPALETIKKQAIDRHNKFKWLNAVQTANNPYYQYNYTTSSDGISINVMPRYHGAEHDSPIVFKGGFRFDDSSDGRKSLEMLQLSYKTGSPAKIDARFVEGFNITEIFPDLFAHVDNFQISSVEILPIVDDYTFAVSLSFLSNDNNIIADIPYIEFREVQKGTEEVTYSNEHQRTPFQAKLRLNRVSRDLKFNMAVDFVGLSVALVRDFAKLQFAAGVARSVKVVNLQTGLPVFIPLTKNVMEPVEEEFLDFLDDLVIIQEKMNTLIIWKDEEITKEDTFRIRNVRQGLTTGKILEDRTVMKFDLDVRSVRDWLKRIDIDTVFQLALEGQNFGFMILDKELQLGPYRLILPSVSFSVRTKELFLSLEDKNEAEKVTIEVIAHEKAYYLLLDWQTSDAA